MSVDESITGDADQRLANRLRLLRLERGWRLEELAARSGVSRASLSRLENGEVSPTAHVLGKLCAAYGMTLSRLMLMVEEGFEPLILKTSQSIWQDPETGFVRRVVSPPSQQLAGEVLDCALPPGTRLNYDGPPRSGLEHHLVLLEGELCLTVDGVTHDLRPGDCLRYQLRGASTFLTPGDSGARYLLFMV